MIRTHVFLRATCRWVWVMLSTAAWSAMAHAPVGVGVLVCAGAGWIAWERLPVAHGDVPVRSPLVYMASEKVSEPWGVAVLVVGIAGLAWVRHRQPNP